MSPSSTAEGLTGRELNQMRLRGNSIAQNANGELSARSEGKVGGDFAREGLAQLDPSTRPLGVKENNQLILQDIL